MRKNIKKLLCVVLSMVLCLALTACGNSAPKNDTNVTGNQESSAAGETSEPIVIRYAHANGTTEDDMVNSCALKFKELAEEYSDGAIRVDIYPATQLGDEAEIYGACGLDTLEIAFGALTNYVSYAPTITVLTLPYIFDDLDQARAFFHSEMEYLDEISIAQANSRILACAAGTTRQLTTKKEVHTLADMKGMKVRVPSTQSMIDCYTAWGASPQVISWGETYTALEQGVAEAQDNPIYVLIDNKLAEVQNYVVEADYMIQPNGMVISEDFYQRLSPELQDVVTRAGMEACAYLEELCDIRIPEYQAQAEAEGVVFLGAPDDLEDWKTAARGIWVNCYDTIGNGDPAYAEEVIKYIQDFNAAYDASR